MRWITLERKGHYEGLTLSLVVKIIDGQVIVLILGDRNERTNCRVRVIPAIKE